MSIRAVQAFQPVWRVGRAPDAWSWPAWEFVGGGRWDDFRGNFRTIYAADTAYACFVEVLAHFRPEPELVAGFDEIDDDMDYPTIAPGLVPRSWLERRSLGSGVMVGLYVDVRHSATIATLRPYFVALARRLGFHDFDAAAIKNARPRELSQSIAHWLYALPFDGGLARVDGVQFASRYGGELNTWAIFESGADFVRSQRVAQPHSELIAEDDPGLMRAFALHMLEWGSSDT